MTTLPNQLSNEINEAAIEAIDYGMNKIQHCVAQLSDDQIWWRPHEEMNAIGNLLLHLAGNLRQWIVSGVGDLEDTRDRPAEFAERTRLPQAEVLQRLQDVVEEVRATLTAMDSESWLEQRRIQGNHVSKLQAMMHSVTHFQGHVQEIIGMTRQQLGGEYAFEWSPQTKEEGAP